MQKKTLLTAAISLAATQTAVYSTTANAESLSDLADGARPATVSSRERATGARHLWVEVRWVSLHALW